jgi:hypothetical protein
VHERVDPTRAGRAEQLDLGARQLGRIEHPGANGIVDVVVDIGDAIDQAHDLALQGVRLVRPGVVEDPVSHFGGQIQPAPVALEHVDDSERVLVVAEAPSEALAQGFVERLLARVPEGRVSEVVAEADRLHEVLVQPQALATPREIPVVSSVWSSGCGNGRPRGRRKPASCASAA